MLCLASPSVNSAPANSAVAVVVGGAAVVGGGVVATVDVVAAEAVETVDAGVVVESTQRPFAQKPGVEVC